jgi:hypothetical protein
LRFFVFFCKYHSQQWRQKTEVTCWYCGEKGHTKGVCRHGTYVQCNITTRYINTFIQSSQQEITLIVILGTLYLGGKS